MASAETRGSSFLSSIRSLFSGSGYGISILVPLHLGGMDEARIKNWIWLQRYWRYALLGAELVIGSDVKGSAAGLPFSKSVAVNDAAARAKGDVFLIVDADVYLDAESVLRCAKEIRAARKKKHNLWFVPYRHLYRLTPDATEAVLASDAAIPLQVPVPPPLDWYENKAMFEGTPSSDIGHWYGAMAQVMSREAFEEVGGWDERFRGWGGEDHAAMVAMDALYGPHKVLPGQVVHLWHPMLVSDSTDATKEKRRMWAGQTRPGNNNALSGEYYYAKGDAGKMRRLLDRARKAECAGTTAVLVTQPKKVRQDQASSFNAITEVSV